MRISKNKIFIRGIGKSSDIDDSYNEARYIRTQGVVEAVGDFVDGSMLFLESYTLKHLVQKGETVLVTYHSIQHGVPYEDGYIIDYSGVICVLEDDDEIVPVNGNVVFDDDGGVVCIASDIDTMTDRGVSFKPDYPSIGSTVLTRFKQPLERTEYQELDNLWFCHVNIIECSYIN